MNSEAKRAGLALAAISVAGIAASFLTSPTAGFVCAATLAAALVVFGRFTRVRLRRIAQLSDYLGRLSQGRFDLDIRDNAEGELSILKSELYTLTSQLSEQAARLRRDKEGLRDVLSDISHQLKTPLTSLSVMSELLEDESMPPEKRREFIQKQKKALLNMEWMVLQLLKMAQLDAGTIRFKSEPVSADELIDASVEAVSILLELKAQRALLPPSSSLQIPCDPQWTKEALTNIVKNASEHTPVGGVIRIDCGENPLMFFIRVADSGNGIAKSDMPHLFDRFRKSGKQSGVGLGLALSRTILRGQNGDIEATSPPGEGAAFTLRFYKEGC